MTIHRLTLNIVFFALGLNIALASASPAIAQSDACDGAAGCLHPEIIVEAIKISRPARSDGDDPVAAHAMQRFGV